MYVTRDGSGKDDEAWLCGESLQGVRKYLGKGVKVNERLKITGMSHLLGDDIASKGQLPPPGWSRVTLPWLCEIAG